MNGLSILLFIAFLWLVVVVVIVGYLGTIAKKCSIPSETTVRKAIAELEDRGLITKDNTGRNNIYKIEEVVYLAIDKANNKDKYISELEATPTHGGVIESEEREVSPIPPEYDEIPTHGDSEYQHMVRPNNIKRIKLINYTNPLEEKETNSTKQNSRVRLNRRSTNETVQ